MPGFPVLHDLPEIPHSFPLSCSCYLTISFSATLFFCLQSFPALGSFPVSWLFTIGGQSIGALASSSVLSMNIQGLFPLGLTGLICLLSKGFSRVFSSTTVQKVLLSTFFMVHTSHSYMTAGKTIALTIWTFASKVMSLLFNTLSRFVIAFVPRSKHLLISWLQSPSAVILGPKKIESVTASTFSSSFCHVVMGLDAMIFIF